MGSKSVNASKSKSRLTPRTPSHSQTPPTARGFDQNSQGPPSQGFVGSSMLNASHLSMQGGLLPTPEDVSKVQGQALTAEELAQLQSSGSLPMGINLAMMPTMHKVKSGAEEILVVMIDAPPCGCRKVNGKKERCRLHRREKRNKKKAKKAKKAADGMVKDDDSDRNKIGALRHAEDSDEEKDVPIEGAITPDDICIVGPAGVGLLVPIDTKDNACAGPRAKDIGPPVKGILVKGPQDCPQFIPEDKIPKNANGDPQYVNYQKGTLVQGTNGTVFYPEGGNTWDVKGKPVSIAGAGIDKELQKKIGDQVHLAGTVDVNEAGMPEFRVVDEKNPAPQDKFATLGMLVKVGDQLVFMQSKGQTVGSGDAAAVVPTTQEGAVAAGTVLGDVIIKDGKPLVVEHGKAGGATVVGTIVQGDFNQPVFVAKTGAQLDKGGVAVDAAKAESNKEEQWKEVVKKDELLQKGTLAAIENTNMFVQAQILGKDPVELQKEMEAAKAAQGAEGPKEVISCAFGLSYQGNRSVFAYQTPKGAGGSSGTGGGYGGGKSGGGGGGAGGAGGYGGGNDNGPREVVSVAFGQPGYQGANQSVFAYQTPKAVGASSATGGASGGGKTGGASGYGSAAAGGAQGGAGGYGSGAGGAQGGAGGAKSGGASAYGGAASGGASGYGGGAKTGGAGAGTIGYGAGAGGAGGAGGASGGARPGGAGGYGGSAGGGSGGAGGAGAGGYSNNNNAGPKEVVSVAYGVGGGAAYQGPRSVFAAPQPGAGGSAGTGGTAGSRPGGVGGYAGGAGGYGGAAGKGAGGVGGAAVGGGAGKSPGGAGGAGGAASGGGGKVAGGAGVGGYNNNAAGAQEVVSVAYGVGGAAYQGPRSVFAAAQPLGGGGSAGTGGAGGGKAGGTGGATAGGAANTTEVVSVAFNSPGAGGGAYAPKSVFFTK